MSNLSEKYVKSKKTAVDKIYPYTSKLQRSYKFAILMVFLLFIVSGLQIAQFSLSYVNGNPSFVNSPIFGSNLVVTILSLSFTTLVIPFGIISSIAIGKHSKSAFWFIIIQFVFFGLNAILLGLWFSLSRYILVSIFLGYQYINWDKSLNENRDPKYESIRRDYFLYLTIFLVIVSIGLGFLINKIFWDFSFLAGGFNIDYLLPFLDASATIFGLIAFYMLSKNKKEGYAYLFLLNVINIILYSVQFQYTVAFNSLVFLILDSFGMIAWEKNFLNNGEKFNNLNFALYHNSDPTYADYLDESIENLESIEEIQKEIDSTISVDVLNIPDIDKLDDT